MHMVRGAILASTLLFSLVSSTHAQGIATVGGLVVAVQQVEDALNDTVANAGTEGRSVVQSANGTLNGALDSLKSLVNNDLSTQISQLSGTAQSLAAQMQNTVTNLNDVLAIREQCGVDDIERLVYGVKTVTTQLQNSIPFTKKPDEHFLYSFKFDGHHQSIVPAAGGRLTIQGSDLWPSKVAPKVSLVDGTTRKVIKVLDPQGASDTDSVSVVLDQATVTSQAGQCPAFEVVPQEKDGFWVFGQQKDLPAMYLPICIPRSLTTSVRVRVSSSFECQNTGAPYTLESKEFRCDNSACGQTGGCNVSKSWIIPNGCTVLQTNTTAGSFMHNATVGTVGIQPVGGASSGNYSAVGTIPSPSCQHPPLTPINRLVHPTIWQVFVQPVVQCTTDPWLSPADVVSDPRPVNADTVPICVSVPPKCTSPQKSTYQASLELLDTSPVQGAAGATQPITLVTTNQVTAIGTSPQPFNKMQYQGIEFDGTVNPVAGDHAQVCMTVTMPQCGY
jgi:hypothetical protein